MDANSKPSGQMVMKLVHLNGIDEGFKNLVSSTAALLALPYVISYLASAKEIEDKAKKYLSDSDIERCLHEVYGRHFTGDDILDIIAFFKTRAGKKFCKTDSLLREDMITASTDLAVEVATRIVTDLGKPPENPL